MPTEFRIYCDGACSGNPGPGGAAYHITQKEAGVIAMKGVHYPDTTNNRMELQALILALRETAQVPGFADSGTKYLICSDSKYLLDGCKDWLPNWVRRDWKKADRKPVENKDLWVQIYDELVARYSTEITYQWVKGHDVDEINALCDQMAVAASKQEALTPPAPALKRGPLDMAEIIAQAKATDGIITGIITVELDELFDIPSYQRMAIMEERLVANNVSLTQMSYEIISGKGQHLDLKLTGSLLSKSPEGWVTRHVGESVEDFFARCHDLDEQKTTTMTDALKAAGKSTDGLEITFSKKAIPQHPSE